MQKKIFNAAIKRKECRTQSVALAGWRVVLGGITISGKTPALRIRSLSLFVLIMLFFLLLPGTAFGQATAHHTVTVVVQTITLLQINVGTIALNITGVGVIAGQDQMTATDQSTTILWGTNSSLKKITVNTNLAAPIYVMKVLALNPTTGTATSEVTLSTLNSDLIINIGRSSGSSSLRYTGVALASQGVGKDTHFITFTIQSQ